MRSTVRWSLASGKAPVLPMVLRPRHLATPGLDLYLVGSEKTEREDPILQGGLPDCESGGVATKSQQDESGVLPLCQKYIYTITA